MFKESLKISWFNLIHNKMRSFLTILGIVIGVASIIALITIVQGATNEVTVQMQTLGADKITVNAYGTALKSGLTERDLTALSAVEHVAGVSPNISGRYTIAGNGKTLDSITVQGKNQVYFQNTDSLIDKGRFINRLDVENANKVCLIGSAIRQELFWGISPLGKELIIGGLSYKIVGVLQESSSFSMSSTNNTVIIPYTAAMKLMRTRTVSGVEVFMSNPSLSEAISADLEQVLYEAFNYKENSFRLYNLQEMLTTITRITGMLSLMLGGIASISLIVGGIGIMNMMLVSVTERTPEIGLRKALGAEPARIRQQFIMEAVFLSLAGGIIGLLSGTAIAFLICAVIGITPFLTLSTVLLALGFSAAVGILFGYAPARKASKLNPIDALRSI